jgi:carboxyl-terminal processing protease
MVVLLLFAGVLLASRESKEELFRALGNLAEVVHLIRSEYVDELNDEALALSLDAGILESIDSSAAVIPTEMSDEYSRLTEGPPAFGLMLASRLSSAAVRQAIEGSPAAEAGLEAWEIIERVDGVNTRGRPLWQLRLELRQKERDAIPVTLTMLDREVDERRDVILEAVDWELVVEVDDALDDAVVIQLSGLAKGSADQLRELVPSGRAVVLDLRELVWGIEDEAIAVADLFVGEGSLGGWKGRKAGAREFAASSRTIESGSVVALIGSNTEGVGEILAAALQRSGVPLIGNRTVGHAPHMRMIRDGQLSLWIPVGEWLRGDGSTIKENGVEPDEVVEIGEAVEEEDPVLDRALELIRSPLEEAA